MAKNSHEIRDPIHVFVRLDSDERQVLNSAPFQRLRHIQQLALTSLVYPGATHKRFEHSLGVMELAGKIFDVVTHPDNLSDHIRKALPEITRVDGLSYWRRALRMAALCHDLGHLPFSHAAEVELLPANWSHERLSSELILSEEMERIWSGMTPPLRSTDIVKLALGPKHAQDLSFSIWETVLAEIIVGDVFGVDRIDYLLRDSYHAGVGYGRFDHYRLLDTIRILPALSGSDEDPGEPVLGIQEGGLQSAESLLLARYAMYSQVYFHRVRRIYDIHLRDFLKEWLTGGQFDTTVESHLLMTDNEVAAAYLAAARDPLALGHDPARRIVQREHFRVLYQRNPTDLAKNPEAAKAVCLAASERFGEQYVRRDVYRQKGGIANFPVQTSEGGVESAMDLSETLSHIPVVAVDFVFIAPEKLSEAQKWLSKARSSIIALQKESDL